MEVLHCPRQQARGKAHVPLGLLLPADGNLPLNFPVLRAAVGFRATRIGRGLAILIVPNQLAQMAVLYVVHRFLDFPVLLGIELALHSI